jgi:nitronate monooxygenase
MIVSSTAADIVYTPRLSGVHANFLRPSIAANGLDPDDLPEHGVLDMGNEAKVWTDFWSAGHGVATIHDVPAAAQLCHRLIAEYLEAMSTAARDPYAAAFA